jgi:hypothetical protein
MISSTITDPDLSITAIFSLLLRIPKHIQTSLALSHVEIIIFLAAIYPVSLSNRTVKQFGHGQALIWSQRKANP